METASDWYESRLLTVSQESRHGQYDGSNRLPALAQLTLPTGNGTMTISRTVFFSLAGLLLTTSAANAQYCSRSRSVVIHVPRYHHYIAPQVTYHTTHRITSHGDILEAPPAPGSLPFGGFTRTDELANRLEVLMNELCLDLFYNYSHNPGFRETYAEAYSLYKTVQFIHACEHNYDRPVVQERLAGADALFHHIEDDVCGWTRIPHRQIGTLGINAKMDMIEETLHCLMEDVGVSLTPGLEEPPLPDSIAPSPVAPAAHSLTVPAPPAVPVP